MKILGIESSCDDTSVALIEANNDHFEILAEKTASQIDIHKVYGGVVPEIAGRKHAEAIVPLIEEVTRGEKPEVIAVTAGPGLVTGLLVGVEAAKNLSYLWDVPLVRVNHIEGHIYSVLLGSQSDRAPLHFPALCLIVSGGHTELVFMKDHGIYELVGKTRDDAAGECFDKVAKLLELDYPGGPKISKLGIEGDTGAISFPRPMIDSDNFEFSFAGLKTAALYWLRDNKLSAIDDFCASFEQAIVDVLVTKTIRAAKEYHPKTVILSGGVSANKKLRESLGENVNGLGVEFRTPELKYSMDNGAMIAVAGHYHALKQKFTSWRDIQVDPNWKIYN